MFKIKYTLCFAALMVVSVAASAQLLDVRIGSDALVEDAIKDAVVIVESSYCIQDVTTGQKYGRNNKKSFNRLQFLGCKAENGIIVSEKVIHPWNVDVLFDKYRNDGLYRPIFDNVLTVRSLLSEKDDTINIASNLSFNNDSTVIYANTGDSSVDGIPVSVDNENIVNWIVWIKNPADKEYDDLPDLEYTIVKKTIDFSIGNTVDTPPSSNSYLGGLYVSAKVVSVGLVEFSLSGFLIGESGKWIVMPIDDKTFAMSVRGKYKEKDTSDDGLTPVKDKEKKNKKKK
ncbi:MAG: hypothetical protein Q4F07_07060 [Bacteroidales bacterium]|nr:hypothetical protein [Bacteroidales bacterium]